MFLSIPSKKTITEYNNVKSSQTPIKMNSTSPQFDDYVYDKYGSIKTLSIIGLTSIINIIGVNSIKDSIKNTEQNVKNKKYKFVSAVIIGLFDLAVAANLIQNKKEKEQILNNEDSKRVLYKRRGLNAVI